MGLYGTGQAGIMVVIDMSDSTPALHYNSLPRIVEQLILYFILHTLIVEQHFILIFYFLLYTLYTQCQAILYTLLNIISSTSLPYDFSEIATSSLAGYLIAQLSTNMHTKYILQNCTHIIAHCTKLCKI